MTVDGIPGPTAGPPGAPGAPATPGAPARDVFAAFASGLRDGALPPGLTAADPGEAARRFAVYRNTVAHSLARALAARFPVVERLVGARAFAALARAFAEAHRPESPVLMRWGEAFPAFLAAVPALAPHPYLPDVARIERARGEAFHAADRAPLGPEALAAAAADPAGARLALHPSVRLVASRFPAVAIWAANQPGVPPRPVPLDRAETALVLRDRGFEVPVRALGPGDAALAGALLAGGRLLPAAAAAARAQPGHDPLPLLALLAGAGALVAPPPEDPA